MAEIFPTEIFPITRSLIGIERDNTVVVVSTSGTVDILEELREIAKADVSRFYGKTLVLAVRGPKAVDLALALMLKNVVEEIWAFQANEGKLYRVHPSPSVKEARLEKIELPIPA